MSELFRSIELDQYDLYHARYGRGAIVIAIKNNTDRKEQINGDKYVAQVYASGERHMPCTLPVFDPIESIEEINGVVRMVIRLNRSYANKPSYRPINALIERIVPVSQVTLEIVTENESVL